MILQPSLGHKTAKAFAWFFAALSLVALLSQPGASKLEWFHAASIWCGHGERTTYCSEIKEEANGVAQARTNFGATECLLLPKYPLVCPTSDGTETLSKINDGLQPNLFYFVFSWLVVPSVDLSILIVRLANALIVSILLGLMMVALPNRHRVVMTLMILCVLSPTGVFVFASISPSSWSILGVGFSWLSLHAAFCPDIVDTRQKRLLIWLGIALIVLAVGSQWNSIAHLVVTSSFVAIHLVRMYFRPQTKKLFPGVILAFVGVTTIVEVLTPSSPMDALRSYIDFVRSQSNGITPFVVSVLQKLPNVTEPLGSIPTTSIVDLPELAYVFGLTVLGVVVTQSYERNSSWQKWGSSVLLLLLSFALVREEMFYDYRAYYSINTEVFYPLFVFGLGWWFLTGPMDLLSRLSRTINPIILTVSAVFCLVQFTAAERFVDRQTYGLRLIPDSPDAWWWSWMPVGPTVVVLVATYCFYRFLSELSKAVLCERTEMLNR